MGLDLASITGLSEEEAETRLREEGKNELPSARGRSVLAIGAEVVREPMFLLLAAGGALYLILGDLEEALMLLGFVLVVMGITLYQERKTERALEALRDLSSPRALGDPRRRAEAHRRTGRRAGRHPHPRRRGPRAGRRDRPAVRRTSPSTNPFSQASPCRCARFPGTA